MRFELVDAVVEEQPGRIVTVKSVTSAEEYLADHFPGFPVLPGVMMVEAMVQAARLLLQRQHGPGPWVLAESRNIRYGSMVRPGQQLRVDVQAKASDEKTQTHSFAGRGEVEGQTAVQGRFTLRPIQIHSTAKQTRNGEL